MTNLNAQNINEINSNQENWFQTNELLDDQLASVLKGQADGQEVFFFLGHQQGIRQLGDCVFNQDGWVVYTQGGQDDAFFAFKKDSVKDDAIFGCLFTSADLYRAAE